MSAQPLQGAPDPNDPTPEWFFRLGLHEPDQLAKHLAAAVVDDPFEVIGFTALAVSYFWEHFGELVDWLAEHESVLATILPVVAAGLPLPIEHEQLQPCVVSDQTALPLWLRDLDKLECTGIMRRYDLADRSSSSYLIEARLADGQVATARLSISHDGVDRVGEFWTTSLSLSEASRFYRKRYAGHTTRPYRHVKIDTACRRIIQAVVGSMRSGAFFDDSDHPIPWPQNAAVLILMLDPVMRATLDQQ